MTRACRRVIAACAGVAIGIAIVGGALALTRDGDHVDGTFVLDDPGVYSEPVTTLDQSGKSLPDVQLKDADGQPVALRSFSGKPLVVNIWYSTCAPCAQSSATLPTSVASSVTPCSSSASTRSTTPTG